MTVFRLFVELLATGDEQIMRHLIVTHVVGEEEYSPEKSNTKDYDRFTTLSHEYSPGQQSRVIVSELEGEALGGVVLQCETCPGYSLHWLR